MEHKWGHIYFQQWSKFSWRKLFRPIVYRRGRGIETYRITLLQIQPDIRAKIEPAITDSKSGVPEYSECSFVFSAIFGNARARTSHFPVRCACGLLCVWKKKVTMV